MTAATRDSTQGAQPYRRAQTDGIVRLEPRSADAARVAAIFQRLATRDPEDSLARTSGVFEFNIPSAGRWCLRLENGVPHLETELLAPDCVITCGAGEFLDVAEGRSNLVTAFLQGQVTCTGNVALALSFRRLLPVF